MSEQVQAILAAAINLSAEERASIVNRLQQSLDEEPVTEGDGDRMEARWAPEIRRRIAEVKSGEVKCIPWEEADARIRKIVGETS